jgi:hypothetical protein
VAGAVIAIVVDAAIDETAIKFEANKKGEAHAPRLFYWLRYLAKPDQGESGIISS